ncbi:ATP-binding region ATPase domain protein (plasmid) [Gemmatirosa kalamazoonensis]|uniref:histidine kinase n=2 Tax=Gemmatirosa kalamazoonensis TaxID=861299 RepID=W0RRC6_9BACT|nr:ATP-binding region ATPase domain protein [Gemmatirosa kalamazoonensis]
MLATETDRTDRGVLGVTPTRWRPDMLAVVAHDLRQPVSAVLMAAEFAEELLGDCSTGEMLQRQLALVQRCARETLRIAEDLLTMGQVEAGALRLRRAPVDVRALLEDVRALVSPHARAKSIHIGVGGPPALPHAYADRDRLLQVLGNLCGNAIKYTPKGGRVCAVAEATDDAIRISITDNGPGVRAGELGRLFDEYWQGDGIAAHAGVGLGLAIARWLVEAHGGRIAAETVDGGGLCVAFTLPVARGENALAPNA